MIKAVLLDLDDTLVRINTPKFTARYLTEMGEWLAAHHPELDAEAVPEAVRAAARATIANLDPARTNWHVFEEHLAAQLDSPGLLDSASEYHGGPYQSLGVMAERLDVAAELITRLIDQGLAVIIATNPLFKLDVIRTRMAWAGLLPDAPYAFISNADELHFTKPQPHFYEELMARTGFEADEAIMVGDSPVNDMIPARSTGMFTFWIHGGTEHPAEPGTVESDGSGTLEDFAALVEQGWLGELSERPPAPRRASQIVPRLLGNTAALHGMIEATRPSFWPMRPDPEGWSPMEIICHLRDSEAAVQRARLERIASDDNPFMAPAPEPLPPGARDLSSEDPHEVFQSFWAERQNTLTFLNSLSEADWNRPARHSIFGPTTLLEMAHFMTRHDRLHLTQLCQTLGQCKED